MMANRQGSPARILRAFLCAALFSLLSAAIAPKLKKYVGGGAAAFFGEK